MIKKIPKPIIDAAANKNLVFFLGSGASVGLGYPNWRELVLEILKVQESYIDKAKNYSDALESGIFTPLEILDKLTNKKKYLYEVIENVFSEEKVSQIHKDLGVISRKFVTTNFDKVIESNVKGLEVVSDSSSYNLTKMDKSSEYVLKIHGCIDNIAKAVLFTEDYEALYEGDTLSKFQLSKLFSDHVFVFIGFSFEDHYVNKLFQVIADLFENYSPEKYLITTKENTVKGVEAILLESYADIGLWVKTLLNDTRKCEEQRLSGLPFLGDKAEEKNLIPKDRMTLGDSGSDLPPSVELWAGRVKEMRALEMDNKVIFITGFGGQGKSALAATYQASACERNEDLVSDWRDFKEEEHNFASKIIGMIRRISDGGVDVDTLIGQEVEYLIDLFFSTLGDRRGVFVLDNVDSYIELDTFYPIGNVGLMFKRAMEYPHKSKFIFTCRPFIKFAGIEFYQLNLKGLIKDEVIDLFDRTNLPFSSDDKKRISSEAHAITNGHPLWINLLIAQARRGRGEVERFLERIKSNHELVLDDDSTLLSVNILTEVWGSLNEKQKLVLRSLSEMVRTESIKEFEQVVSSRLNHNQLTRALQTLNNLNLIVTKMEGAYVELHPLVREFIRTKYPRSAQSSIISLIIQHYDKTILIFKKRLSRDLSFVDFQTWTGKVELYLNKGDVQRAIDTMRELVEPIKTSGYIEEYVRVGLLFVNAITWTERQTRDYKQIDSVVSDLLTTFVEFGKFQEAEEIARLFERIKSGKVGRELLILSHRIHLNWFKGDFSEAIKVGEKAEYHLESSRIEDRYLCAHRLALARRDSRREDEVRKAMKHFLVGEMLDELLSGAGKAELGGPLYGNVGQCLMMLGDSVGALNCLCKSYQLLEQSSYSDQKLNLGYASSWISNLLLSKGNRKEACYFLLNAEFLWRSVSPPLANGLTSNLDALKRVAILDDIFTLEFWRIEKHCTEYVHSIVEA